MHACAGSISPRSAMVWSWMFSSITRSGSWPVSADAALSNLRNTSANEPPWSLAVSSTSSWLALNPATMFSIVCLVEPPMPPYQRVTSTGPDASSSAPSGHSGSVASPLPSPSPSPSPVAVCEPSFPDDGGSLQAAATTASVLLSSSARVPLEGRGHLVLRVRERRGNILAVEQHGVERALDGGVLVDVGPDQRPRLVGIGVAKLLHRGDQQDAGDVGLPEALHLR